MSKITILLQRFFVIITALLGLAAPLAAAEQPKDELLVAAAASLTDVLKDLSAAFQQQQPNVQVSYQFAASGALQQQIEQGAPIDLFISAANTQVDALQKKGLLEPGSMKSLLSNRLVLIAPQAAAPIKKLDDLKPPSYKKIAIGENRTVPAGQYAEAWLSSAGLLDALRARLVPAASVRQVLTLVETGNVAAGFVYASDAKTSDKVKIILEADPKSYPPIAYPLAIIKRSKHKTAAASFARFLQSPAAQAIFQRYGFILPREQAS